MKNSILRKVTILSLILCMFLTLINVTAQENISVLVNNIKIVFDQEPVVENDRTLVPLRAIFEALGAEVSWDNTTLLYTTLFLTLLSTKFLRNGCFRPLNPHKKRYDLEKPKSSDLTNCIMFLPVAF